MSPLRTPHQGFGLTNKGGTVYLITVKDGVEYPNNSSYLLQYNTFVDRVSSTSYLSSVRMSFPNKTNYDFRAGLDYFGSGDVTNPSGLVVFQKEMRLDLLVVEGE